MQPILTTPSHIESSFELERHFNMDIDEPSSSMSSQSNSTPAGGARNQFYLSTAKRGITYINKSFCTLLLLSFLGDHWQEPPADAVKLLNYTTPSSTPLRKKEPNFCAQAAANHNIIRRVNRAERERAHSRRHRRIKKRCQVKVFTCKSVVT